MGCVHYQKQGDVVATWLVIYTVGRKIVPFYFCLYLHPNY